MIYAYSQQADELAVADYPLEDNLILVARAASPTGEDWTPKVQLLAALLAS
jgi:hypothetical protein